MNVLSIQSHVVYGRVGNRSAVFPLERMGINVWPLNTVQYSSHTGRAGWTGTAFGADHLLDIVTGLDGLGCLADCDAILSGYMGDADTGLAILEAVRLVKSRNPKAIYCCDPVMGDYPGGLYVRAELPALFRDKALALADVVIPNRFEAELLSGIGVGDRLSAMRAALAIRDRGPSIAVMTSYPYAEGGSSGFLLADGDGCAELATPTLPFSRPVKGSGDLFGSLFLGNLLTLKGARPALAAAASSLFAVLRASLARGDGELALVEAQDAIARAPDSFRTLAIS